MFQFININRKCVFNLIKFAHNTDVWNTLSSACTSMWSFWKQCLLHLIEKWFQFSLKLRSFLSLFFFRFSIMCCRVFNKTIILLGLAGYEMIITNSALCASFIWQKMAIYRSVSYGKRWPSFAMRNRSVVSNEWKSSEVWRAFNEFYLCSSKELELSAFLKSIQLNLNLYM